MVVSAAATATSTIITRVAKASGVRSSAASATTISDEEPGNMGPRPAAGDRSLEERRADEIERRPAGDRGDHLAVDVPVGMGEEQLVADRRDDDAGDDGQVEVGVGEPRQPARVARVGDALAAALWPVSK